MASLTRANREVARPPSGVWFSKGPLDWDPLMLCTGQRVYGKFVLRGMVMHVQLSETVIAACMMLLWP